MNLFSMLKNVAFIMDPGPSENSNLWRKLEVYKRQKEDPEETTGEGECTLDSVLEEEDLLSFLQHKHQPLIEFLTEKSNLDSILKYITRSPDQRDELSQKSCKILCHNVSDIRDQVFENYMDNLDTLFGFESDSTESAVLQSLNALHTGLLNQVLIKFLNTQHANMVQYFSTKQAFKENPKQLLYTPGLLITLMDTNYCHADSDIAVWLKEINVLDLLVGAFDGKSGESVLCGSADVLSNIIQNQSPLVQQLDSNNQPITNLITFMFTEDNPCSESAISEGLMVCSMLANRFQCVPCSDVPVALQPILDNVTKFNQLFGAQDADKELVNTSGAFVPFGMTRMRVVELFKTLLMIRCNAISNALIESDMFASLLEAFFRHKWNNILQTTVQAMLFSVFESPSLCNTVLTRTNLVSTVAEKLLEDYKRQQDDETVSAYHGFLVLFRNKFIELQRESEPLKEVFSNCAPWNEYVQLDNSAKEELNKRPPRIFDDLNIALDVSNAELYQELKQEIEENGGTVVDTVTGTTSCVVSPNEDIVKRSQKIQAAIAETKPVVSVILSKNLLKANRLQVYSFYPPAWGKPQVGPDAPIPEEEHFDDPMEEINVSREEDDMETDETDELEEAIDVEVEVESTTEQNEEPTADEPAEEAEPTEEPKAETDVPEMSDA